MKRQGWLLAGGGILLFVGGVTVGRMGQDGSSAAGSKQVTSARSNSLEAQGSVSAGEESSSSTRSSGRSYSVSEIMSDGNMGSRFEKLTAKLERTNTEDFGAMLAEIAEQGFNGVMREERLLIISAWAARDPIAAAEYLKEHDQDDRMQFAAMATWASNDPDAAIAWARENHEGKGANDWLVGAIQGIAGTDPDLAASLIGELPRSREQWHAMESTMPYVLAKGEAAAKDWIESLSSGDLQSNGAEWMARRMAGEDPVVAAAWIDSLGTKEARREASEEVALRYARTDLAGAQRWVSSLPEDTRTEAAEGIVTHMAREDPRAAVAWLENLGDDPDYDGAWVDLVERGFNAEPGVALVGALRLSDEGWREKYTNNYLSRWMKQDQAAAQEWVAEYTEYLPPKVARRYGPKPARTN
ncbi:hypothetical protein [Roseibacillus persicicus]|nr:hypothetical protein [Roseibacillus persicicus]